MALTLAQTIGKVEGWKYTPLHGVTLPEHATNIASLFDNEGDQYVWERVQAPRDIVVASKQALVVIDEIEPNFGLPQLEGQKIEVGTDATLIHLRLYDQVKEKYFAPICACVEGGGKYIHIALSRGASLMRLPLQVELMADNAQCDLRGVHIIAGDHHVDQAVTIKHLAPHCLSNQNFRYIVSGEARAAFQGKIHVARDAQKTEAYQLCKSLLLSEGAQVNTKPELEIFADDVKCSHGATTGALDERVLFYMQSRGIPRDEAQSLLMRAFIEETFDGLDLPDEVMQKIKAFLQ